jgi:UDP-2-acetamido-2-deoxy-ribo-hexuluronate aminotransferase
MADARVQFIALERQYEAYKAELGDAIQTVYESGVFIQGPVVAKVEEELARFIGVKHCISCGSGTDALLISLLSVGIKPGDEVITSPFTFFAAAEVVSLLGAKPIFVDIDRETFNINVESINSRITARTKAIIPVCLYGHPADMKELCALGEDFGIPVIEDAAQSFGAKYQTKRSGGLGTIGCTSFYPSKPLGCFGDGGAIFTDNDAIAAKCRLMMNHGQSASYLHERIGINGRLDAIQAAVLLVKLNHYEDEI